MTYLGVGLDLRKGGHVHLDSIGVEIRDAIGLVNASMAAQASSVDIAGPVNVALEVGGADTVLQGDDVLVGDVFRLAGLLRWSSEGSREQSSEEESQTAKAMHLGK